MNALQCQHCGKPVVEGHNCDGIPFRATVGISSTLDEKRADILYRKGFRVLSNADGPYYYHPMLGTLAVYPGGSFKTAHIKISESLDEYLESLPDASYTPLEPDWKRTRCDECRAVGWLLFGIEPFPHEPHCSQARPTEPHLENI